MNFGGSVLRSIWGMEEGEQGFFFPTSVRAALLLPVLEIEVLGKISLAEMILWL